MIARGGGEQGGRGAGGQGRWIAAVSAASSAGTRAGETPAIR